MSSKETYIRGIGNVITDPDVFDNVAESDRLADRQDYLSASEEDDDTDYPLPVKSPSKGWAQKPSIAGQAFKMPSSVRSGPPIVTVLNLSTPSDLQTLNDLQAKAAALDGPFIEIHYIDKQFHQGVWHVLTSHSVISYQQL